MKKNIYIISFLAIAGLTLLGFSVVNPGNRIVYVELSTIYNDFPLKKELESKLINVQNSRSALLDSLKIKLNALSLEIHSPKDAEAIERFKYMKQEYLLKQKNFEEDNQAITQQYSDQIWKQINQYVKDYGKEKGFTYILGTDGTGTVMYGDDSKDITKELSVYVNGRYKGEK